MLRYLQFRRQLAALQRARRRALATEVKPVEGQEYIPDYADLNRREMVEHKILRLVSDYYWELAFRYGIEVPVGEEHWTENEAYPGTSHISPKGLSILRAAIHEERKRKLEYFSMWIAGLTGLIGAITGLVAVILNS